MALKQAAERGELPEVELLLAMHNNRVDHDDAADGCTALMAASRAGHAEVVSCLLGRRTCGRGTSLDRG